MASNRDDFGIAIRYALLQKGAKQKFSLFFLICLSILIEKEGVFSSWKGTKDIFLIHKENKILKDELSKLRSQNFETEFLTNENKRLQEILDSKISDDVLYVTSKVLLDKKFLVNIDVWCRINKLFCNSLVLISLMLWAEPNRIKFFLYEKERCLVSLLNEGIYAPSKFSFMANFILLEIRNLFPLFLQYFFIAKINFSSICWL